MATGQQSFDPDDFIRRDSERDERRREEERLDSMRRAQEQAERRRRDEQRRIDRLADVINDPELVVDTEMMKVINDPSMVMTRNGDIARVTRRGLGTGQFADQFSTGFGFALPQKTKKKRRKNPKLAAAFRQANARYRTKSGKLRKGRTQADIARLAHRLLKRM